MSVCSSIISQASSTVVMKNHTFVKFVIIKIRILKISDGGGGVGAKSELEN